MNVSIALATFNGERHLWDQLNSYATQTMLPDELVAADDGSDDATVAILHDFADQAPFEVIILEGEHLGFAQNFGRAMAATSGDIVFLSDQDDVWEPTKVERVLAVTQTLLVVHDLELCNSDLSPSGQTMSDRLAFFGMDHRQHIKGCCTAIRRELVDLALPIPPSTAHDMFIHKLAEALDERTFLNEPLIRYRLHESNTSGWALNSLAPLNRRLLLRLRVRALRKRLYRQPSADVPALVAARLSARSAI